MVDYEKLGELIDGYDGISADDLHALPSVADAREDEIARTNDENKQMREALADVEDENKRLREALADVEDENKRLREALAEVEMILTSLPSRILPAGINDGVGDVLGRWPA